MRSIARLPSREPLLQVPPLDSNPTAALRKDRGQLLPWASDLFFLGFALKLLAKLPS